MEARKLDAILLSLPALIGLGLSGCALLSGTPEIEVDVQEKVFGRSTEGRPITGAVVGDKLTVLGIGPLVADAVSAILGGGSLPDLLHLED